MPKKTWTAALAFGIAGALIPGGVYISGGQLSALALIQVAVAGGAAALTGGLCWRLALRASNPPPKWLGAWVGGLVGLLAHVPFWYILFLFNWTSEETKNLSHPLHMLYIAPLIAFFSSLALGWITAPVGAATGFLLAGAIQRRHRSPSPPP